MAAVINSRPIGLPGRSRRLFVHAYYLWFAIGCSSTYSIILLHFLRLHNSRSYTHERKAAKTDKTAKSGLLSKHRNYSHHNCYYFTGIGDHPCVNVTTAVAAWAIPASSEVNVFFYQNDIPFGGIHSVPDYSWVEVMRWKKSKGPGEKPGSAYGTWFFGMPGSGVFVNVGRTLRFSNRTEAGARLKSAAREAGFRDKRQAGNVGAFDDWFYCMGARKLGFDSVWVEVDDAWYLNHSSSLRRGQTEMVFCGMNGTATLCTSYPLQQRDNQPCSCNETEPYLTCI
jgi:hypothetical protein